MDMAGKERVVGERLGGGTKVVGTKVVLVGTKGWWGTKVLVAIREGGPVLIVGNGSGNSGGGPKDQGIPKMAATSKSQKGGHK